MRKNFTNHRKSWSWLIALFSALLLLTVNQAQARHRFYDVPDIKVTGKVTDDKGAPVPSVSVVIKGTKKVLQPIKMAISPLLFQMTNQSL